MLSSLPSEMIHKIVSYLSLKDAVGFLKSHKNYNTDDILREEVKGKHSIQIISKGEATLILDPLNRLWVCGYNGTRHRGLGYNQESVNEFTRIQLPAEVGRVAQVAVGSTHNIVLTEGGELWGFGRNINGLLGLEHNQRSVNEFISIAPPGLGRVSQVVIGYSHTLVLTEEGDLWGHGDNKDGQLGLRHNQESVNELTRIQRPAGLGRIAQVCTGYGHSLVLTDAGELWGCGRNRNGQLGLGHNYESVNKFIRIQRPADLGRISQVVTGYLHTLVLTEEGDLWGCGRNDWGDLGLGHNEDVYKFIRILLPAEIDRIAQVVVGLKCTLVLTEAVELWGCGSNYYSQMGLEHDEVINEFIRIELPAEVGRIAQVVVGIGHTIVLNEAGEFWGCGRNSWGELGLRHNKSVNEFKRVPIDFNLKWALPSQSEEIAISATEACRAELASQPLRITWKPGISPRSLEQTLFTRAAEIERLRFVSRIQAAYRGFFARSRVIDPANTCALTAECSALTLSSRG